MADTKQETDTKRETESTKKLSLIQVPFGLGAGRPGSEAAPESMLQAGLLRQLRKTAFAVTSEANIEGGNDAGASADGTRSGAAKHLPEVLDTGRRVASEVAGAAGRGELPLVLGGDRSVTIGVLAGLAAAGKRAGVIYFDAHAGLNTEAASPTGGVGGMALASALGLAKPDARDFADGLDGPAADKRRVVLIGVRDVEPEERALIRAEGIAVFTMHEVDRMGIEEVVRRAVDIAGDGTDGIHVSFSADCLDPLEAPGVALQVPGGLTYREAHFACELLAETGRVASIDVVEVNPLLDESRRTSRLAVGLIASLLGKRIL
ncbi:arginase [Paenibacillus sp. MWE-103]|uniref:Arginase n=1 Tax=Paenibacillus artemisiicola TaxID=1172618 RepID=A0ABS3W2P5_9BACL|nr:arginase [Paenibacillus artemisiicola]MBO7742572.1 arginase [Paenibacillus artemisiicola]